MRACFAIALLLSWSVHAIAADYYLPPPAPAPVITSPPPVAYQPFAGCYGGLGIGVNANRNSTTVQEDPYFYPGELTDINDLITQSVSPSLGATLGCNALFGSALIGLEIDDWVYWNKGSSCKTNVDPVTICSTWSNYNTTTISTRFGTISNGNLLIYGKLGISLSPYSYQFNSNSVSYLTSPTSYNCPNSGVNTGTCYFPIWYNNFEAQSSQWAFAPVLGAGFEYAYAQNWTFRAEVSASYVTNSSGFKISNVIADSANYGNNYGSNHSHPSVGGLINADVSNWNSSLKVSVMRYF